MGSAAHPSHRLEKLDASRWIKGRLKPGLQLPLFSFLYHRPAIFEEIELRQLALQLLRAWVFQQMGHFVDKQFSEFCMRPFERFSNERRIYGLLHPPSELLGH